MKKGIQLTHSQSTSDFPSEWHMIDAVHQVEVKQLDSDTFVLRSPTHEVAVTAEGFNLYRTSGKDFETWMDENLVESVERPPDGY